MAVGHKPHLHCGGMPRHWAVQSEARCRYRRDRHCTGHPRVSLRTLTNFSVCCLVKVWHWQLASTSQMPSDLRNIRDSPERWYRFDSDRFRALGHTGPWWGKLTGRKGRKSRFLMADGGTVEVCLLDEPSALLPTNHHGQVDAGGLCEAEKSHLGLADMNSGRPSRARAQAIKMACANGTSYRRSNTQIAARKTQRTINWKSSGPVPAERPAKIAAKTIPKTRGCGSSPSTAKSRPVRGTEGNMDDDRTDLKQDEQEKDQGTEMDLVKDGMLPNVDAAPGPALRMRTEQAIFMACPHAALGGGPTGPASDVATPAASQAAGLDPVVGFMPEHSQTPPQNSVWMQQAIFMAYPDAALGDGGPTGPAVMQAPPEASQAAVLNPAQGPMPERPQAPPHSKVRECPSREALAKELCEVPPELQAPTELHVPVRARKDKKNHPLNCAVCAGSSMTPSASGKRQHRHGSRPSTKCAKCEVHLCIGDRAEYGLDADTQDDYKKNCFEIWHTDPAYAQWVTK